MKKTTRLRESKQLSKALILVGKIPPFILSFAHFFKKNYWALTICPSTILDTENTAANKIHEFSALHGALHRVSDPISRKCLNVVSLTWSIDSGLANIRRSDLFTMRIPIHQVRGRAQFSAFFKSSRVLLILLVHRPHVEQCLSINRTAQEIRTSIWSLSFHVTHPRQKD